MCGRGLSRCEVPNGTARNLNFGEGTKTRPGEKVNDDTRIGLTLVVPSYPNPAIAKLVYRRLLYAYERQILAPLQTPGRHVNLALAPLSIWPWLSSFVSPLARVPWMTACSGQPLR